MSRPEEEEILFAYIVVTSHAVSLVLVRVENGVQQPVYYVSKSLHEAKVCYLPLGKAIWLWYLLCENSPTTSKPI